MMHVIRTVSYVPSLIVLTVLRRTAWPYPGTTCPPLRVAQMYSLTAASDGDSPSCFFIFMSHRRTSWLARLRISM